ncbi:phage shock protein operon transcriptional activator [Marinobacterium rhizophilum]|uniref:Phage shock protein operon transcriptional activator n=1 Tax=Marinobacterium rhizophilum TaxID=420402 RepID=A0ABY5HIR3_9GAMM|nr:phage shock protein operon transcriptional activator [Marinobacterium rhizophilum]UTW12158.1 phage shock protein operon transcriptional activator [Marinobacterium rhizophilum]
MAESMPALIGSSDLFHRVLSQVSRVAPLNRPVLVIGERGTGKELIAARLHYLSGRWQQPYLQVNCAAMSESLLESELFGHEAGAFTGAVRARAGLFERAEGGTLFLDELSTASVRVQEKLLRIIEYGRFERLGGSRTLQVDVRVVAATNEDLPGAVADGRFRADLLDRLAFDVVNLPPLRYRRDDILELAEHFARRMCRELNYDWFPGFAADAQAQLLQYDWPGNVRELKNVVERSIYRNANPTEPVCDIVLDPFTTPWCAVQNAAPAALVQGTGGSGAGPDSEEEIVGLRARVARFEQGLIRQALVAAQFNQRRAAQALGLTYHQLRAALRKYPDLLAGRD